MFSQYFGHYLLEKGLIKPEQLADALTYQHSQHLKLGIIAINDGLMTPAQVEHIHNMQKQVDRRFGELAVEQGYINEEQLNALLKTQKEGHLMLGQALVDREYFTLEQLQTALDDYKKKSGLSVRHFNIVGNDDSLEIEQKFKNFGDGRIGRIYSDYVTLLVRNCIRFLDENPTIEIDHIDTGYKTEWYAFQEITGKISMRTGIACETAVFVQLAAKFAQEEIKEADELAQASVGEFLNLHNGIFLVNMSNNDIELEMKPQVVTKVNTVRSSERIYVVSCYMTWGKFDLLIS